MVRIIKVKELEERKRYLLAQSEMYRQTMTLELANVKFSTALLKHKLKSKRNLLLMLGSVFPMAGLFLARKRLPQRDGAGGGFLPKIISGMKLFGQVAPLMKMFRSKSTGQMGTRENITQHP